MIYHLIGRSTFDKFTLIRCSGTLLIRSPTGHKKFDRINGVAILKGPLNKKMTD